MVATPIVTSFADFREASGLTQAEVGRRVGVTRQTIAAWERGDRSPSVVQLTRLVSALRLSLPDLLDGKAVEEPCLRFRADDPSSLSPALTTLLCHRAEDYVEVERLAGELPTVPESRPYDDVDHEILEGVAREIRDWLGVEDGPLGDVFELFEMRGLKIISHPLAGDVSGFSAFRDDWGGVIFVNDSHPTERQYFTALHELAHLVLHRRDYAGRPTDVAADALGRRARKPARERAADYVASAILLPEPIMRRELRWYRQHWLPEVLLIDLKRRYRVSARTVLMRAADLKLISDRQRGQQIGKIRKLYGTHGEPGPKLPKPEATLRLERLTMLALVREEMTTSRAAEILGEPVVNVREKLERWLEGAPA